VSVLERICDSQNRIEAGTRGANPRSDKPKTIETPLISLNEIGAYSRCPANREPYSTWFVGVEYPLPVVGGSAMCHNFPMLVLSFRPNLTISASVLVLSAAPIAQR
jgi:hypothetical protein